MDQSKKTMRHFYCRDVLWETFEQMANDFDCSIDYLINESMRFYARSKNYQAGSGQSSKELPVQGGGNVLARPITQPPVPAAQMLERPTLERPTLERSPAERSPVERSPTPRPVAIPVPPAPAPRTDQPATTGGPTLYLVFNNQRIVIDRDQFIIGRGSKVSDLAIKDGNISRKHAAIIRRSGMFYIKDLGSTNGIDYKGMRIDNKRIDEGDVFHICDYELHFTYR